MQIRRIKGLELMEARNISSVCFNWSHDTKDKTPAEYLEEVRKKPGDKADAHYLDTWAAFTEDDEMMASMCVLPYQIYFDGQRVPMAGIGAVCTYPQFRSHSCIRGIFEQILPMLYQDKVPFSFLYPFSEKFYRKFGYERSAQNRTWTLDLNHLPTYEYQESGRMHLCRTKEEQKKLKAIYEEFAARHNLCISRDEYDWEHWKNSEPFKNNRYLYYYERKTEQGVECAGYFVFDHKQDGERLIMDCKEFVYKDMDALRALLALAQTFRGTYAAIRLSQPDTVNLEYFIEDYAKSISCSDSIRQKGMVRVICVEEVLKLAKYRGNGSLSVRITDEQIEENNRVFEVTWQEGKAVSVTPHPVSEVQPDVELSVGLFASAMVGSLSVSDMTYRPEICWHCDPSMAEGIFYKKSNWINNFF